MVHKEYNISTICGHSGGGQRMPETGLGLKSAIIKRTVESDDVKFYWLICQADFDVGDDETYQLLLNKIEELFVTVCDFSYASNLMEKQ